MVENSNLNNYMESFKTKSTKEKQVEIFNRLSTLAILTNEMCNKLNIDNKIITNKEINDLKKDSYTEDDFYEAELAVIFSIENSLCDFTDKITDILKELSE